MASERRNLFYKIALGRISYLEHCEECRTVTFHGNDGIPNHEFIIWEKRNQPYRLSDDFKRFYSLMNGFTMSWTVEMGEVKMVTIGEMKLNKLDQIQRMPQAQVDSNALCTSNLPYMELTMNALPDLKTQSISLFSIDSQCEYGEIVFLYRNSSSLTPDNTSICNPEVCLLDFNGQLTFLCPSFTQYLRLMVVHLGIIGWQGLFTAEGLSEMTEQYMYLFCKERLLIDRNFRSEMNQKKQLTANA